MSRRLTSIILSFLIATAAVQAQAPTGSIAVLVQDSSHAAVPNATSEAVNIETGLIRVGLTSTDGRYAFEALPPGTYRLTASLAGFSASEVTAVVEAGMITSASLALAPAGVSAAVEVTGTAPLMRPDQYQIAGVVGRTQIEQLPLNGRNFLELVKLEPGVTNVRLADSRSFVSFLGAGFQTIPRVGYTRVTVDGASVTTPSTAGVLLEVSQDVVQEFQVSTVNFDASTGLATNGAVNIITRAGSNVFHGGGFDLYRDHNIAAYPALSRVATNPDPFFRRNQYGGDVSGPLLHHRATFFVSYERNTQDGVSAIQPVVPEFAPLGGIFTTPYSGGLASGRADVRLNSNHNAFVRYTHDGNHAVVASTGYLPSGWTNRRIDANQSLVALTSVLSTHVVNDVRASYLLVDNASGPQDSADCPGCFGLGAPQIIVANAGLAFGNAPSNESNGKRLQLTDDLTRQQGNHRLRAGISWEHVTNITSSLQYDPAQISVWSPSIVRQSNPTIALPVSFGTVESFVELPLRSVTIAVGPGVLPQRDFGPTRVQDLWRLYASDTWSLAPRLTIVGGLGWSYEPNVLNYDLTKPALLAPILGDWLGAPSVQLGNLSPTLGFAWTATRDTKTVVRAGAGRYFDPVGSGPLLNLENERRMLLPAGTGRLVEPGAKIVRDGSVLDFRQPTSFTAAQLLAILPAVRADLLSTLSPTSRDFSLRNLDTMKSGSNLYDPAYATPSAIHAALGVQRELAPGLVASADFAWKRFDHTLINGIDFNRWQSVEGPVIPACSSDQLNDPRAICSNGSMYFDTTSGRARYRGLLVRLEKRFTGRFQILGSYAFGSYVGSNGTGTGTTEAPGGAPGGRAFGFNNDNWSENYGPMPTDQRHIFNGSGFVEFPARLTLALNISAYSRPPFAPFIANMDFNGDGTINDLLPGTTINQFNRGLNTDDLVRLVGNYNRDYAGKPTLGGQTAPHITLPANYSLDDCFFTQDVRLTHTWAWGRQQRLLVFAEVFNLLNTANLVQYNSDLTSPAFGQPSARFAQIFGSGGPRAVQIGARLDF